MEKELHLLTSERQVMAKQWLAEDEMFGEELIISMAQTEKLREDKLSAIAAQEAALVARVGKVRRHSYNPDVVFTFQRLWLIWRRLDDLALRQSIQDCEIFWSMDLTWSSWTKGGRERSLLGYLDDILLDRCRTKNCFCHFIPIARCFISAGTVVLPWGKIVQSYCNCHVYS